MATNWYPGTLRYVSNAWRWGVMINTRRYSSTFRVDSKEDAIRLARIEFDRLLAMNNGQRRVGIAGVVVASIERELNSDQIDEVIRLLRADRGIV